MNHAMVAYAVQALLAANKQCSHWRLLVADGTSHTLGDLVEVIKSSPPSIWALKDA